MTNKPKSEPKSKLEIIAETVAHYNSENRAADKFDYCKYFQEATGNMCAVGRCMKTPKAKYEGAFSDLVYEGFKQSDLKPEYRGHCAEFWSDLQSLHDAKSNWTKNGLAARAKKKVESLKKKWKRDNKPDFLAKGF
jgi:hypothetical protein